MQAPFDLAADLDTPVSAYLKLAPLGPRFLLESAAGPERAARYSFLGFGDMDELVLDGRGLTRNGAVIARPASGSELCAALRAALAEAPELHAGDDGTLPFRGGLVGVLGYELARRFEHFSARRAGTDPELRLVAPRSVLVFDHQRRSAALLTSAGEDAALRREVRALLAGPLPYPRPTPRAGLDRAAFVERAGRVREATDGEVYQPC
jgi:anthranilate synthase component 1